MLKLKAILASKQTTWAAVLLALITILQALYCMIDGDPATVADWNEVIKFLIVAYCAFVGRDAFVSDQQSGIRPEK